MKHLIYIYCYHVDLLDEFIYYCYPLVENYDWVDIHVDFCSDTIEDSTLIKLQNKRINYGIVGNKGVDVLPFIKFLHKNVFKKKQYVAITKIHSKKSNNALRRLMYIPLVNDVFKFKEYHDLVEKNTIPIMLNNKHLLAETKENSDQKKEIIITDKVRFLNNKLGLKNEFGRFFFGTMFMTSTAFLEKLLTIDFETLDSFFEDESKPDMGIAHAFERVFGYSIIEFNGKHVTFDCNNEYVKLHRTII